jgi:hypothetical protein
MLSSHLYGRWRKIMSNKEGVNPGNSRRTVLKAGVATGVGLVAWSVPSITSLGGTPVYAAGCTFVQNFKVANCRNTTRQTCGETIPFSYQPLDAPISGFSWATNVGNTCCNNGGFAKLNIPAGLECKATVSIYPKNGDCTSGTNATQSVDTPVQRGQLTIPLDCLGLVKSQVVASSQYDVQIKCNSIDAPPECLA